ncbi:MAG TPA: hypothetical protein V6D11_32175 [Waterburya sp.]|jgi:hypothetical protein
MQGTLFEDELSKFCHRAERERTTEARREEIWRGRVRGEGMNELTGAVIGAAIEMTRYPLGLLINFNVPLLKDGIRRIIL